MAWTEQSPTNPSYVEASSGTPRTWIADSPASLSPSEASPSTPTFVEASPISLSPSELLSSILSWTELNPTNSWSAPGGVTSPSYSESSPQIPGWVDPLTTTLITTETGVNILTEDGRQIVTETVSPSQTTWNADQSPVAIW